MPSLADRTRVERTLRIVGLASLALWIANAARPAISRVEVATDAILPRALPQWTRTALLDSVHAQLDTVPDATSVAWLAALRRAGVGVSWSGPAIPATAIEVYPAADPAGGVIVRTSAPQSAPRIVSDALGPVATLRGGASSVRIAALEGDVTLTTGSQPARAEVAQRNAARRVFVTGVAGWEAKFVIAALEEAGWAVEAHVFVAPDHDVTQGAPSALDTARYAAAVLLDSAGTESARGVEKFVREGGGVVLVGDANLAARAASLTAWRPAKREVAPLGTLAGDSAWRGLARVPLELAADARAVVLERRSGRAELVVRRHYAGRVAAVGYDQTWRWRMAGGDSSRVEHREWWSRVVASVAQRPEYRSAGPTGAAPLSSLYDVLGPPSAAVRALPAVLSPSVLANVLGALLLATLMAEWWLRRARGAK